MRPPLVVAHRGASGERAEHTLRAYELALEQGADGVECDVRLTRDGHLVCMHDRTLGRTTGGASDAVVSTLTLAELRAHDVGSWHPGGAGRAEVLALAELLDLVADHAGASVYVETKHPVRYGGAVERALAEELGRRGAAAPPTTMMSFSVLAVRRMRRLAPTLPTVMLRERRNQWQERAARVAEASLLGPSIAAVRRRPDLVPRWRARGRETFCWTVDEADDIALCRALGVHAMGTNYPARTLERLHSLGRMPRAGRRGD